MKQLLPLLFCLSAGLLAGCRADDVIICAPVTAAPTFANLRAVAPAVQKFIFNLAQAQSFRTRGGATVAFGPNAFALPNGSLATGQAELRVREIYSVADMILANMPTTAQSSRQMLISGGEFNIQVWQGSTRLSMALTVATSNGSNHLLLTSPVPTAGLDTTRMLLWKQLTSPLAGTPGDSSAWQPAITRNAGPGVQTPVPSVNGTYSVSFPLDSIGNWNIDQFWHFYQSNSSGNIGVVVPTSVGATATRVYFRPIGFNGLARCYAASTSTTRWNSLLPYGVDVVAVVLQERNGQFYYGTQRVTTTSNLVVTPTLQALSMADIVQRIRQL